jgi:diguanylate cyclase (GGDEF)-like protein/putative nucleotidyltransferase with HDIG domain
MEYSHKIEDIINELNKLIVEEQVPQILSSEMKEIEGFVPLYKSLMEVRNSLSNIAKGDLDYKINREGYIFDLLLMIGKEHRQVERDIINISYHDQLTGLYNRRYYDIAIKKLDNEKYYPLTFVMGDINGLKLTNDAFGHQVGDILLEKISLILKNECDPKHVVSRVGGDEFIILMPNTSENKAIEVIKRIKQAISNEKVENIVLSLSLGFEVKKDRFDDIDEVYKRAEDKMYSKKLFESTQMKKKTVELIMKSLYEKNSREMLHSKRVSELCTHIAEKMGLDKETVEKIRLGGLMHDIGKIGIDQVILNKPKMINAYEWSEVKRHSEIGYRLLNSIDEFSEISRYVLEHHERWDGKGYPKALKGKDISIGARVIAIADSYEAMTSDRTYAKNIGENKAIEEIIRNSGTQFDAEICRVFIEKVLNEQWVEKSN